jgi:hypothetical protein
MTERTFAIASDHPDALPLLRASIVHNAACHRSIAVNCRTRDLNPGETRAQLEARAAVHDERAGVLDSMLAQLPTR